MVVSEATTLAGLGELLQLGEAGVTGFLKVGFCNGRCITIARIGREGKPDPAHLSTFNNSQFTAPHTDTHTHAQHSLPRLDYQTTTLGHLGFNGLRW